MNKVNITCSLRLHISLLAMSNNLYRRNGGIGFFINSPGLSIKVEPSPSNILLDTRLTSISSKSFITWLENFLLRKNIHQNFKITISGIVPSHMGFGVSTSVRMACIEGIYRLLDKEVSNVEIIQESHRGGTSGIGVHGYFQGGFLFDMGHELPRQPHLPSRSHELSSHLPLLLNRLNMPNWELGILIPKTIPHKTHDEENSFFKRTCPIDDSSVYETTYHALFGVLASVQTENFDLFCKAINSIQKQTWKKSERNLYPKLKVYEDNLKELGAQAVGMSSLGPSLYFFSKNIDKLIDDLKTTSLREEFDVFKTSVCNHGRIISNV